MIDKSKAWDKFKDYLEGASDTAGGEYKKIYNKMIEIENTEPSYDDKLVKDFAQKFMTFFDVDKKE